jgi:signal transduction histidine kinase
MRNTRTGLKQRIELVMVGVLMVSFIIIGGGVVYYVVNQYERTNRNTIAEKTQSVLMELRHKLNEEIVLHSDWRSEDYPTLGDLLVKFSIVFNSDINLYDPYGEVLATSRPEIFDRKLVGRKMDPMAYHEMTAHDQMEYVHFENIGNLRYLSAYVPFYNMYNELVAYLNLPYFAKQSVIRQEISTFIVAVLNAYFLLIFLAVVLAVLLSNQVTKPLRLLQEKFARMELGGINQTVEYKKRDEIGSLVKSYNRMVDELEESADKLARSERETAWREMARQIAHEIKNPLTPMKLSVQQLRRAWDDKVEDWETYFYSVSETLIEQINSLSSIADEFAQFARMPQSKLKDVDIVRRIKKSVELFRISETGKLELSGDIEKIIPVYTDEDQIQQVFNNLLKNAFQSVPKSRNPKIKVVVGKSDGNVIISFEDNGSGIDPEISEKLFQPNFTTKTSGMGLGLAISKSIIDSAGGKIWYETEQGKGSVFYISLPISNN